MAQEELYQVHVERNVLIPLPDGASLAADIYRPAAAGRFPALLSYYPYHKDDFIGAGTEWPRRYFAERGYACLLVDFRGLGGSSGVVHAAMDAAEGRDGAAAVEWAACQPWCDGNVGMWGLSYGAFLSLKTAAENPPHLKAIAPIQGSLDIYRDYFFPGGCHDFLFAYGTWGSFMLAMNLMPPTRVDADGRWYRVWLERLENAVPFLLPWRDHPSYDAYWRSRAVPAERVKVPTFVIGGWRDMFPESMPRLYQDLAVPKRLLMGPWMHTLPDLSPFEPVDYLHEMRRWFDRWLKDERNGVESEPPVLVFVQGAAEWRHERAWPVERSSVVDFFPSAGGTLAGDAADAREGAECYAAIPSVGTTAGQTWDPAFLDHGRPLDQGPDDLRSLTFTSAPLGAAIEISGSPEAALKVVLESGDELHLVAKLCDVAPDGRSALITGGWLNARYRLSNERPEALRAGETYDLAVRLSCTSYLVRRGHRLRLSVSCADFPRVWPTRCNPTIRVLCGGGDGSRLSVPTAPPAKSPLPAPEVPRPAPGINRAPWTTAVMPRFAIEQDLAARATSVASGFRESLALPGGATMEVDQRSRATVADPHPEGARVEGKTVVHMDLPSVGAVEVETESWVSQDGIALAAAVRLNGREFFSRRWRR